MNSNDSINIDKDIFVMENVKCIIFDLDGTLVNTIDDLGLACDYLLDKKGIAPHWTADDYKRFVGNGARLLVSRAFEEKLSEAELDEQYALFKIKYNEIKLDHAHAYADMPQVVNLLKKSGYKLAVCTNKPNEAAVGMVEKIYGKNVFDYILGAADNVPKKPAPNMANIILNAVDVKANECVWIGDSSVDVESAKNIGCQSIAVTWGFRSLQSLIKASPTVIINSPKEILKKFNFSVDI